MEIDNKHFKFKHPFTCLISGPTESGKTFLIRNILKNYKFLFYNLLPKNVSILRVLWCYGQWQNLYSIPISDNIIIQYTDSIVNDGIIKQFSPNIIIVDDLLNEFDKTKHLENIFIKKSHHMNISVIFVVQNLFAKSIRTISLNSHYIILMKSPRSASQIQQLAKQIFPMNSKAIMEAFTDATTKAYGYLIIDLKQDTPENYRLRTRITSEEVDHLRLRIPFAPIVYKFK